MSVGVYILNKDLRALKRVEQRSYFREFSMKELEQFADENKIDLSGILQNKLYRINKILDELEKRGVGIYPSMPEGVSKDILNIILDTAEDTGAILQLIMTDARIFRYERDNKELFWKVVFYRLFPEYVDAFVDIKGGDEYKNLVLWLSWGTRHILKLLEKHKVIHLEYGLGNRERFPVGEVHTRIDILQVGNWRVTRRTFAHMYGFHKGRLLALYAPAEYDRPVSSFDSVEEYIEHKGRSALFNQVESYLSDIVDNSKKFGHDIIDMMIAVASDQGAYPFKDRFSVPPKTESGIITLGLLCISCKTKEAQWQSKSDATKIYCSRECFKK